MPKFLAIYHQEGGCDYTIGCGIRIVDVEAPSMDAAIAIITKGLAETGDRAEYGDETVESLHKVDVYEIATHENAHAALAPDIWLVPRRAAKEEAARARTEAKERAELDRLNKKYAP